MEYFCTEWLLINTEWYLFFFYEATIGTQGAMYIFKLIARNLRNWGCPEVVKSSTTKIHSHSIKDFNTQGKAPLTVLFPFSKEVPNMNNDAAFDYYYGDESEQFSFYRIPRQLVIGERFKGLSTDAKLLYGLLLDRMGLSAKNGWYDEKRRVYIFYTLNEIQEDMNCGHEKAVKLLAELDMGHKRHRPD